VLRDAVERRVAAVGLFDPGAQTAWASNEVHMDSSIITAAAALLGSLAGASASIFTTWMTQRNQLIRDRVVEELRRRELLYEEFIKQASNSVIDSLSNSLDRPDKFVQLTPASAASGFSHRNQSWLLRKRAAGELSTSMPSQTCQWIKFARASRSSISILSENSAPPAGPSFRSSRVKVCDLLVSVSS